MPFYNCDFNIFKESINSILNQTYNNFELILIMDKISKIKDNMCSSYIEQINDDKRIKIYINKNNLGFTNSLSLARGDIHWDSTKPDGQPRRCLDVCRAKEEFRFEVKTEFKKGLKRTIEWYKNRTRD